MFSECLFCVRSHLRYHVDFQAVEKTQPGPVDPQLNRYVAPSEKKVITTK